MDVTCKINGDLKWQQSFQAERCNVYKVKRVHDQIVCVTVIHLVNAVYVLKLTCKGIPSNRLY